MLRLLHTADVHLDSPLKSLALCDPELAERADTTTRAAFSRIIDTAIAEDVAALLIAGDLFDGRQRSARTGAFLIAEFDRLRTHGIRVFYVKGNHDAENPVSGAIDLPDNVHVFGGRAEKVQLAENVWIHGISYARRHAPESLLPKFHPPVPGAINIGMLHTSLAGAPGHDVYAPCTVAELAAHGFDYWALGHVHKRQVHHEDPWIVMPGTPQGRDIGETGPKTATLITIADDISIHQVPTSILEFATIDLPLPETESDETLRMMLRQKAQELARSLRGDLGAVRVRLSVDPAQYWKLLRDRDVWNETVRTILRETSRLWLEKLVIERFETKMQPGNDAIDELGRLMDVVRQEEAFRRGIHGRVEEFLSELPPELRTELAGDETGLAKLADDLALAGRERVLAHMRGGENH